MAILGELGTQVLIPIAGVIGIVFAVAQWVIVSKVKVTPGAANASGAGKNGYGDYLIEEEEGLNDHNVVVKCAEIQTAISEVPRLDVAHPAPPWMKEVVACLCVATPVDQLPRIDAQVAARLPPLDAVGWALGPSEGEELDLFM